MKSNRFSLIFSAAALVLITVAGAKENVNSGTPPPPPPSGNGERTAMANCIPASAQVDLDINNVRAKLLNGGDMWWDIFGSQNAAYQVPRLANNVIGPSSQFASSVWVGGYDAGGQLKSAAQTYRQTGNDYWPGPLSSSANVDAATCLAWDKFWKLNRKDAEDYYYWVINGKNGPNPIQTRIGDPMNVINTWPAFGPEGQPIAPFYDVDGDGFYDPSVGDIPDFDVTLERGCGAQLFGDQNIFWVFNDKGNVHTETGRPGIGLEIQAQAFGFITNDEINNATFLKYKIINKSSFRMDSTFFGFWDDADLGYYLDDYVGCDVGLGMGILYNGNAVDGSGQATSYGANPPAIGIDFFEGPFADPDGLDNAASTRPASFLNYGDTFIDNERLGMCKFVYYNNTSSNVNGNPDPGDDVYQYLTATWKNGQRITYGGDGITGSSIVCDYMFPGNTDQQQYFGTNGAAVPLWDEVSSGNQPNDRRFVISSGPFTLQPGAVNYITAGVPWARATQGGNLASVALLKGADAKLQQLFNNCFATLDGPTAPILSIRELDNELILSWSNPQFGTNNVNENYKEDYDKSTNADSVYRFQGYQIYQLKDASVSSTELYNPDKARLVFQCDKKDNIAQIVNYTNDINLSAVIPQEMVNGENKGVVHSISIKSDKFATGVTNLVNFKKYYYTILAYAYSPTQVPVSLATLKDYTPYLSGRKNAGKFLNTGIPHKPSPEEGGTTQQSAYGSGPKLTRIEGQGNGGNVLDFTPQTISDILNSPDSRVLNPTYANGAGPATIKIVDPLSIPQDTKFRLIIKPATTSAITVNSRWQLVKMSNNCNCSDDIVNSELSIKIPNEQIINGQETNSTTFTIPKWGLAVNIVFAYDPGNVNAVDNSYLTSSMTFADPYKAWLTGIQDSEGESQRNWIRSGEYVSTAAAEWSDYAGRDDGQSFEKIVDGTWAPYRMCGVTKLPISANSYLGGPAWDWSVAMAMNNMKNLASVDVVFTSDKSKWTRCPVLEMAEETAFAIGGAKKMFLRRSLSVDKNGNPASVGSGPSTNPNDANYIGETGMGWFPGYAINLETGERLNMAFGEDSGLPNDNGRDMIWNPTSSVTANQTGYPLFGGKHYVYVFGHNGDKTFLSSDVNLPNVLKDVPRYDAGQNIYTILKKAETMSGTTGNDYTREVYADAMWVNIPLLVPGKRLLETDATVKIRVTKSYQKGYSTTVNPILDTTLTPINRNFAVYDFDTKDIAPLKNNKDAAVNALDLINVVPNPYYAYSGYEVKTSDYIVKLTNLPERCTITIYTLNGTLIRKITKDDPTTYLDWDLKNQARIPISSGMYMIHVDVPDVGVKTLKWFGIMRPQDLEAY
jgi:hypothetical protein